MPHFASLANALSIADTLVFDAIITAGMTIALVSGGFDLSVGSVFASSGVVVAVAMASGLPPWLAILVALLSAAGWGLLNGFAITKIGVNPLLTTLAHHGHGARLRLHSDRRPGDQRPPRFLQRSGANLVRPRFDSRRWRA